MSKKRGALSTTEMDFIRENSKDMTVEQICKNINRSPGPIIRFCKNNCLPFTSSKVKSDESNMVMSKLIDKPYYVEIKKQFTQEELRYFSTTWARLMYQFNEDVHYTEELQIKDWITLEIMRNRCLKERREAVKRVDDLRARILNLRAEDKDDEADLLEPELSIIVNSLGSFTTEYQKILAESARIQKDLKGVRSERIKRIEDSKSSFSGILKALEDNETRKQFGEDAAVLKLAADKAAKDLSQFHTYENGEIDQPYLTTETAQYSEEELNEEI